MATDVRLVDPIQTPKPSAGVRAVDRLKRSSAGSDIMHDTSVESLSRQLQTICGRGNGNRHRVEPRMTTNALLSPMGAAALAANPGTPIQAGWKPVRVYHEETSDKLRQSLSKICQSPCSSPMSSSTHLNDPVQGSTALRVRESLKSGVRIRCNLADLSCTADCVYVCVHTTVDSSDRCLKVCNADTGSVILTETIPAATRINALSCCIIPTSQTLYIRERSKETTIVDVETPIISTPATRVAYLPVMCEDETLQQITVTVHIADAFSIDSVIVRTVDDHLVVRAAPVQQLEQPRRLVTSELPDGTVTRSVRAAVNIKRRQLVVTAQLSSAARRMTCNF